MYCMERNNTTAILRGEREQRTNGEAHEAKTCCDHISVVWCKMLKTIYKYATSTVKHIAVLSFICDPHKSCSNVNSNTALPTVSTSVS